MFKVMAHCTCKVCGRGFVYDDVIRRREDAANWIAWAENHYDLCRDCRRQQRREAEKAKGLYVDVRIDRYSVLIKDDISLAFVFFGDTYPYKDAIQALGGRWTNRYPISDFFGELYGYRDLMKRWVISVSVDCYADTVAKIEEIGGWIESAPEDDRIAEIWADVAQHRDIKDSKIAELGEIPQWPERIKNLWPPEARWNRIVYGRKGSYCIYLANQKIKITNAEKHEMESISEDRDDWRSKWIKIMER